MIQLPKGTHNRVLDLLKAAGIEVAPLLQDGYEAVELLCDIGEALRRLEHLHGMSDARDQRVIDTWILPRLCTVGHSRRPFLSISWTPSEPPALVTPPETPRGFAASLSERAFDRLARAVIGADLPVSREAYKSMTPWDRRFFKDVFVCPPTGLEPLPQAERGVASPEQHLEDWRDDD